MGRGRAPCCEKVGLKKGPWTPAEDMRLVAYINKYGHENWRALPKQAGLLRCGKSCRLRWINYLRPDIKRGNFNQEEEETIIKQHGLLGNKWSKIASYLPGRTDNEIKNVWNTHLKKRLVSKGSNTPSPAKSKKLSYSPSSSISSMSHYDHQRAGGTADEEKENPIIKSESTPADESYMEQLEIMQEEDPLEEIIQLPLDDEQSMDIWDILDGSKEAISSPSSSACSSHMTFSNQVVAAKGASIDHDLDDMGNMETKQENPKEFLEIPVETEYNRDFWDMLDGDFYSFSSSGGALDDAHQNPAINEALRGDVDFYRWMRCSENQMDMWMMGNGNDHKSLMKTEIEEAVPCIQLQADPDKYFQTWPQSPLTFSL